MLDPSSRLEFMAELRALAKDDERMMRFKRYALDMLVEGLVATPDDKQYQPEFVPLPGEEREAYLSDLAEQMAPALSRFLATWALFDGEWLADWRARRAGGAASNGDGDADGDAFNPP